MAQQARQIMSELRDDIIDILINGKAADKSPLQIADDIVALRDFWLQGIKSKLENIIEQI